LLLLLKHWALAPWGWRLIDQISGEVLLGLVRQMQPSLRHLHKQDSATGAGRIVCDSQALGGVLPILVRCHGSAQCLNEWNPHRIDKVPANQDKVERRFGWIWGGTPPCPFVVISLVSVPIFTRLPRDTARAGMLSGGDKEIGMKQLFLGLVLGVVVASAAAADDLRDVNVVNGTGYGIKFLGFNNPGDDDWSDNELGSVLANGASVFVKFNTDDEGCVWNFKIEWADAGYPGVLWRDVNLCEINTLTLRYDRSTDTTSYSAR
jgi:hypothetical protein